MRASRLLSILMLLQTRGQLSAQALADELEVSVRTVYRDIDALAASGVPIYSERGPAGGYRLLDGYRTRLTGLTSDEAASLFLVGLPNQAAELGLGAVLAAAELKLLAALPPVLREGAGRIRERFHLDAPGWFHDVDETPYLAAVADAVWNQRAIRVRYQRWRGEVERTLEPIGVVLKGGVWYLVARADGQLRTYRVGRILDLTPLDATFERPARFDLAAYWSGWSKRFETTLRPERAIVRLSPRGRAMLAPLLGAAVAQAVETSACPADADGWVQAELPIESIRHGVVDLLKLGAEAEALAPPELRAQLAETVRTLAQRYCSD